MLGVAAARVIPAAVLVLAGCSVAPIPSEALVSLAEPANPLSKVYVANRTDHAAMVNLRWADGSDQMFRVARQSTQFLSGAIGVVAMPPQIDVLTPQCDVIATVDGLPDGAGLLVVTEEDVQLYPINQVDRQWRQADHPMTACGVTIQP